MAGDLFCVQPEPGYLSYEIAVRTSQDAEALLPTLSAAMRRSIRRSGIVG